MNRQSDTRELLGTARPERTGYMDEERVVRISTVQSTRRVERSYGLHCWGLILSLFFAAIIITISAILILEVDNAVVILSVLLVLLVVVAVGIAFYIQIQRRKAARRRDQMAEEWVRRTVSQT